MPVQTKAPRSDEGLSLYLVLANTLELIAPPRIPEAIVYQADFLVNPNTGAIVARRLGCVIY